MATPDPLARPPVRSHPPATSESELRDWLISAGIPVLPYALGQSRLHPIPCIVPALRMKALREAARALWRLYEELRGILTDDPSHLHEFFSLTQTQQMLWYVSGGLWHGIARTDVFCTTDGSIVVAELNSDTPSGLDEAYLLGRFAEEQSSEYSNPNEHLPAAFASVVERAHHLVRTHPGVPTVAIIYPTDIPEDMGMITLYRYWLECAGYRVLLGSPLNVRHNEAGRATLFGTEIDVLLRHYKTDWWCERTSVWKDSEDIPDPAPLMKELQNVIAPMIEGELSVVNPFGAIVTQNKLSLAFFHENIHLFSDKGQLDIRRFVPFTQRLTQCDHDQLIRDKDSWVLKSDYGCEGSEVILGRLTEAEAWERALSLAVPGHWIVQRYFEAERDEDGMTENYGVFLADGEPCGMYLRLARGITSESARIAPIVERPPLAEAMGLRVRSIPKLPHPHPRVLGLFRAYTPPPPWLPFRMALLMHSAAEDSLIEEFHEGPETEAVRDTAKVLARLIRSAESALRGSVALVCDLSGPESVVLAEALGGAADVVLQIENIAHPYEFVPLRQTLGALVHCAHRIRTDHEQAVCAGRRPPVFVLDRRRTQSSDPSCMSFDNRHWAYLPAITAFNERGIATILYIHPDGDRIESDDLNEDFLQYHDGGLRLCYASPQEIRSHQSSGLAGLLDATCRTPLPRQTIFSYMFPRARQGAESSQHQEATTQ